MIPRDALGCAEIRRGHRIVGPVRQHEERRHWVIAGIVVAAIGVAVSAAAAVSAAQQQEAAAKFNKKVAFNQALAAQQAAAANASNRREQIRRVLAQQRADIGGSGIQDTAGSPLLVQIDSAKQGELDALRIEHGGQQQALAFETQGAYAKWAGNQAAAASYTQAGTSLLQGVSSGVNQYQTAQYRQQMLNKAPATTR